MYATEVTAMPGLKTGLDEVSVKMQCFKAQLASRQWCLPRREVTHIWSVNARSIFLVNEPNVQLAKGTSSGNSLWNQGSNPSIRKVVHTAIELRPFPPVMPRMLLRSGVSVYNGWDGNTDVKDVYSVHIGFSDLVINARPF